MLIILQILLKADLTLLSLSKVIWKNFDFRELVRAFPLAPIFALMQFALM